MKKLFVVLVMLVTMSASAQWVQMSNGMGTDKTVYSMATIGNNVFAGTDDDVYLSTNNGVSWIPTGLNKAAFCLCVNGNNLFAGTYRYLDPHGVYLSTNNGTNWTQTSLNNQNIRSLAISGNNIFAGSAEFGVYLSTNNGINWTATYTTFSNVYSLAASGNNIFAGSFSYGAWRTTDNGMNWIQIVINNNVQVYSFGVSGNTIYAGTWLSGIYKTTNDGINWTQTSLNNVIVYNIIFDGNNIFAGTSNGVYLSTNNGTNWILKNQGFGTFLNSFRALTIKDNYIFVGTAGGQFSGNSVWRRSLSEIIGIQNISTETPSKFSLSQNYPNPFNPATKIKFAMPNAGGAKIVVYDVMGREVQTLVNERLQPGTYETTFDGALLISGVYFYKLMTDGYTETKKMLIIK